MQIATRTFYDNALAGIEQQRAQTSKLTQELGTGKSVNAPSDNPAAFADSVRVQAHSDALAQYTSDNGQLSNQLGLASHALDSVLTALDSIKSVALQAANATTSGANRQALAQQVVSAKSQLLSLANTRSGSGSYLFAGTRSQAAPFTQQPSGTIDYRGDGSNERRATSINESVTGLLSGSAFASVPQGNGYGAISAASSNSGSATATLNGITNTASATAFRDGSSPYTISFATGSTGLNYTVTQGGSTVSTGAFSSGMTLTMAGMSLKFSGTPASGDQFTLAPSRPQSIFATLDQLTAALKQPQDTAAAHAQFAQQMGTVIDNLDQTRSLVLAQQSTVGVALSAIQRTNNTNATQQLNDAQSLSSNLSADIPKVITALNEHQTALSSTMAAFGALSKLSLFNYL